MCCIVNTPKVSESNTLVVSASLTLRRALVCDQLATVFIGKIPPRHRDSSNLGVYITKWT